jgi:RHS repeat-associated protein
MTGTYIRQFGKAGSNYGQFNKPEGIAVDSAGNLYIVDDSNNRVQEFNSTGGFLASFGEFGTSEGQFYGPVGIAISSGGDMYVTNTYTNQIEIWAPINQAAHATKTIYYTAKSEAEATACQNHPEWALLPCMSEPAAQPERGLPQLPVTTTTYNMYEEPQTITSTSGSSTRTTTNTYEESGRPLTTETTATIGTALPKVTDKYSETTGLLTETSTSSESIKSVYNTLDELTSYTDAGGNVSTFEYEPEKDARLTKINDGKGTQKFTYDETTGLVKTLVDSSAGTFTAGYDLEGNLTSEGYPNGMTAKYTLNATGEPIGLAYKKETHCTEKCEWYFDNIIPSIHGQWLTQNTSFNKDNYTYDAAGRLTESQVTPTGSGGCVTRHYTYDEDTNRTGLATYQPNAKGECATETGTIERHTYDEADRLLDPGTSYDAFGNTTNLPADDAGGSELTSSFYVDNQLANQTQAGETIDYDLDPAGRTSEIISTGKIVASETQHYAGPGDTPAWTAELSGNWTRKISTMSGLSAIEHNGEAPILQLTNLHGDIVATAQDSETTTGLASTIKEASDYGVPATETPPKYSWLGSHEIATELPSGVTQMGARSYVPELGRFLQTDPRPGGSANAYAYVFGDPINTNDLTGEDANGPSAWALRLASELSNQETAAYEAALRAEAERKAREAAETARTYAAMQGASPEGEYYEEEGPEEEYWEEEEEEGYEEVAYHPGARGQQEARVEPALLVQPFVGAMGNESPTVPSNVVKLCVKQHDKYACARYADFLGIEKLAEKVGKAIAKGAKSVWNKVSAWAGKHANAIRKSLCDVSGWGSGLLTGIGATDLTGDPFLGGAAGIAVGEGVKYACEH